MAYSYQHYAQQDGSFVQDLHESQQYVWKAAQWLSTLGLHVTVRALRVRGAVEEMAEFADDGDLEIIKRIEVKHRKDVDFTGAADYPFPDVLVDVCHTWDKAGVKPEAYLIFNPSATCLLMIKGDTKPSWIRRELFDKQKSRKRAFYFCPVACCRFYQM